MTEQRRNLIVGLTTLSGVVGLIGLLMLFGYLPQFLQSGYEIRIELPRAAGLHEESRVRFSGIDIGSVTKVRLQDPPEIGVVVTALIRPEATIPADATVNVSQPLLGGGSAIEFELTGPLAPTTAFLPTDGTAVIDGEIPAFGDSITGQLQESIKEPIAKMERLTVAFEQLSAEWTKVGGNIRELTAARTPDAVDKGDATGNLATVIARLDSRLAELEQVMAGINAYVNDEKLREDIRLTAANAQQLTGTANESMATLTEKFVGLADEMSATIASAKSAIDQASQPNGTLGKLVADPALYNNLNDAAERLQKMLDETRLLVQKWKAEGLPVQF